MKDLTRVFGRFWRAARRVTLIALSKQSDSPYSLAGDITTQLVANSQIGERHACQC
jgi:hypothetical protein